MPRASAKAATRRAAASARNCARRSRAPASPSSARTAWASPAAHRNFCHRPRRDAAAARCRARSPSWCRAAPWRPSINRAINDLGLKTGYLASCGSQIGCKDLRLHRLLRRHAGAARHPLLHRGRARRRALPRSRAARARERQDRGRGEGRRVRSLARRRARAYRLARRQRGGVRGRRRQRRRRALQVVRGRDRGGRVPRPPAPAARAQHRGDVQFRRAAQPGHRSRRARRRHARHASRTPPRRRSAPSSSRRRRQSARHQAHHPAEQYAACLDTLVDAPEVDIVLAAEDLPLDDSVERRVGNLRVARRRLAARRKRSARPSRCSRRCWRARPNTAARCARKSRMCR